MKTETGIWCVVVYSWDGLKKDHHRDFADYYEAAAYLDSWPRARADIRWIDE